MKKYRFFAFLLAALLCLSVSPPALALDDPDPQAKAVIVVDGDYGQVLYDHNAYERMYPASVTKIMTSLVVLDAIDRGELTLDTPITASAQAVQLPEGSSTAGIQAGEVLTVEQLLYCDLVPSANEACNILAEAVAGTTENFVARMNEKAAQLGMTGTHFANPHGLHDPNHYTTAYDIYLMASAAMKYDIFRTIVSTPVYVLPATNMSGEKTLHTTNYLLSNRIIPGYIYEDAIGIKTGYTDEAGSCLACAAVDSRGRTFYCVILGAENVYLEDGSYRRYSFYEGKRMLEWAFANFQRTTLLDQDTGGVLQEVPVTLSEEQDYVGVLPVGSIESTVPIDYDPEKAQLDFELPKSVEAPIAAGDVLGTVTLSYEGTVYGTLDMVATYDVARSEFLYNLQQAEFYWSQWWVKALVFLAAALLLLLLIYLIFIRPRSRRRYSYSGSRRGGGAGGYRGRGRR